MPVLSLILHGICDILVTVLEPTMLFDHFRPDLRPVSLEPVVEFSFYGACIAIISVDLFIEALDLGRVVCCDALVHRWDLGSSHLSCRATQRWEFQSPGR